MPLIRKLAERLWRKVILKRIDYSSVRHKKVEYLPAVFNNNVIFELPPIGDGASKTQAKAMKGMDKRYNGHLWTKKITTNITDDFGLSFRYSSCIGWLRCINKECEFLNRRPQIVEVNEIEFEECTF